MYGMVNRAIRDLVLDGHDEAVWHEICDLAGLPTYDFNDSATYDDAVTYDLVNAASEVLGASADDLLRAFGRHWILFTGSEGWGSLFAMAGDDLTSFISGLDALHSRVQITMPECRMPSFRSERRPDGSLEIEYRSERAGLGPMVAGLLAGLAEHFGETWSVESCGPIDSGEAELFVLRPTPADTGVESDSVALA